MKRLAIVVVVAIAGCSGASATPITVYVTPPAPTPVTVYATALPPTPVASVPPSVGPVASAPPSAAPVGTASPAPSAGPTDFTTISRSGSGSKVEKFSIPDGDAALAVIRASGSSDNFVVESLASDGSQNDMLVNTIGDYSGAVLFDQNSGVHSVALRITSSGRWSIKIEPVAAARAWDGTGSLSGKGDDVVAISPQSSGLTTITITHDGVSNFVVTSYDSSGQNLLVNEIGQYGGQTTLPAGSFLLSVTADGAWTITVN